MESLIVLSRQLARSVNGILISYTDSDGWVHGAASGCLFQF